MLISVGAPKGSVGATTFAALLARQWPTSDGDGPTFRVLLEADPDGAVLGARWHQSLGVTLTPGLVELVSGLHANKPVSELLVDCSQDVGAGVSLIPGLPGRAAQSAAVAALNDNALAELARSQGLVVADVGRMRSATTGLIRRSQLSVLVAKPDLEAVQILKPMVAELSAAGGRVGLVLVGSSAYERGEIAEAIGVEADHVWAVPHDKHAGPLLMTQGPGAPRMRRAALTRRVTSIAAAIEALCRPATTVKPATEAAAVKGSGVATVSFEEVTGAQ